jgi:membrane peptidoglycan carboxypeptidase
MTSLEEMSAFPKTRGSVLRVAAPFLVAALMASACSLPRIAQIPHGNPAIPPLSQTTLILDDHGRVITRVHAGENRTLIPLSQVPQVTRDAVIAAEDERFYQHHGIDAKAIIRAALKNAEHGEIVQGGSTITEQLVKNTLTGDEKTIGRKIREAELAYQLEDEYTKDQILEMYLNTVYFGQGAYGIQAAAKTFFSIPAFKLSLTQSALLAAVISSPSTYDPVFHPDLAIIQRNAVLARMLDLGMIGRAEFLDAVDARLGLDIPEQTDVYSAPYFVDYVKRWFLNNPQFGETYEERYHLLFEGGLRIFTTVDLRLQRMAETAVNSILSFKRDPYGAMTVLDPRTGAILAMVGGRGYFSKKDPYAQLNLATGGATGRQAGSAFKPFTLVAALRQGISPQRVYAAPPHLNVQLPPDYYPPVWPVDNYDGEGGGSLTIEQATIFSVNTVYAQLIMDVGPQNVVDTARLMGITSPLDAVPSAVLGTNEVNTLEMASAYGTLATMGRRAPPIAVTKIANTTGELIYQADQEPEQVLEPGIAWTADQILQKVVQIGTGTQANIGRPVGGKTGTAQQWRDAWFVGFVPQMVAAVWVGFPKGSIPMAYPRVRIPHVLGGTWPAEIWHAFMVNATRSLKVQGFPRPAFGYVTVPIDITRWCLPNAYTLPSDIQVVQFQEGAEPTLVCTEPSGPQVIIVPSVIGLSKAEAVETLESYGFLVEVTIANEDPGTGVPGAVLAQDPPSGTETVQGTTITLLVAPGKYPTEPPPPPPSPPPPSPSPTPTPTPTESPSPSPSESPSP